MSSMQVTMSATFGVKQVEIARSSLDEEQIPWGTSRLITKLEIWEQATNAASVLGTMRF
jgi:hypothetical protein